jgi:predicted PurR-regulated permease PerM/RimJ/RimL family protein N-acetyltransferase
MNEPMRRWNTSTKRTVSLIIIVLAALIVYRFRTVLPPLIIAFLAAFILDPIVAFLARRLRITRTLATTIVFIVLIAIGMGIVAAPVTAVPNWRKAVLSVQIDLIRVINEIGYFLEQPVKIWDYTLDLSDLYRELSAMLRSFIGSVAQGTIGIVGAIASGLLWLIVILITTFYLLKDAERIVKQIETLAPPGYRDDIVQLRRQITDVWHAFLRGQLLMCLVIAVMTTVVGLAIGLPYAVVLGILAGILEFVPNLGPALAFIPAVLLALFEGSNFLPMSNFWFAVLVAGAYILIQQIESNLLGPRVMGHSLNLHPLVVLIGVIVGGNLAGILGMLLAAPVLATLRVISNYVFCRLYDQDPFKEPEKAPDEPLSFLPKWSRQPIQTAWRRGRERLTPSSTRPAQIRPAQPEDRAAVEAICAQRDEDYVLEVWEEWLADPHGLLAAAEVNGRVVGFAKLTRLPRPDTAGAEWWLEGLRVDAAHMRQGVARQLQTYLLTHARQVGGGLIRLGTHSANEPVHRLAARDGFRRVAAYRRYRAEPLASDQGPQLRPLSEADLPAAWALLHESPRWRAANGLFEENWTWANLSRARLSDYLSSGHVWGLDADDVLIGLSLIDRTEEKAVSYNTSDAADE